MIDVIIGIISVFFVLYGLVFMKFNSAIYKKQFTKNDNYRRKCKGDKNCNCCGVHVSLVQYGCFVPNLSKKGCGNRKFNTYFDILL